VTPEGEAGPPRGGRDSATQESDRAGGTDVHAFLIADVRGYTAFTQERGDEDAGRLAARFAAVARAIVGEHQGELLELRGDEALCVFGSPRSAIRAAVALQDRFVDETVADPSLPLAVGIGLDAGEAVPVDGGYRGGALNVAARLCSTARAGEILASREIVHLARRIGGVTLVPRGSMPFKGLDRPVEVMSVRAEDRDVAAVIAPYVRPTGAPPERRRLPIVAAAVVAILVVAALIAIPIVGRDAGTSEITPNSIGVLDGVSGELEDTIELGIAPGAMAATDDGVWVTNAGADQVWKVEFAEGVVDRVDVGENPSAVAVGFNGIWVVESGASSVSRINADTHEIVDTIPVGNGPSGIAVGEGSVWVTNRLDGTVSRIDPGEAGPPPPTIAVGLEPSGIAVGLGAVWVALVGASAIARIDPASLDVQLIPLGSAPTALAIDQEARRIWTVNTLADTVSLVDPDTGTEIDTVQVGRHPTAVALASGSVWVGSEADGTLSRLASDQAVESTDIQAAPQGLIGVAGDLWVSVREAATSHRGGTLRVVAGPAPTILDPQAVWEVLAGPVVALMGDGLVGYRPVGGVEGLNLVPDLARSLPVPTNGGRTYRFELRQGIRYSNGEEVRASDFLHAFERGFRLQGLARSLFLGLEGGRACDRTPAMCDLSRGIEVDDGAGTVSFNLVAPDPDFLARLTVPFAYPVPASVPDEIQAANGVPGTGPYALEAPMTPDGFALVRNDFFEPWSTVATPDGNVDRIEWTLGVEPDAQVEAILDGKADVALDLAPPAPLADVFAQYAERVHLTRLSSTYFAWINTAVPPFDDPDVRRAINLAVDRQRIVEILGGTATPTCQHLPPNFPGYSKYCPAGIGNGPFGSWNVPDLEGARALVRRSGTAGMRVTFGYCSRGCFNGDWPPVLAEYIRGLLEELGFRAHARGVPLAPYYFRGEILSFNLGLTGWAMDFPGASSFLADDTLCASFLSCDPDISAMAKEAAVLQSDDPVAAGARWAAIDRALVDRATFLWLVNPIGVDFVSERVGNYQRSHQLGIILSQLWVR
jgi:peptide/nickel transport system substrate-binding protein